MYDYTPPVRGVLHRHRGDFRLDDNILVASTASARVQGPRRFASQRDLPAAIAQHTRREKLEAVRKPPARGDRWSCLS